MSEAGAHPESDALTVALSGYDVRIGAGLLGALGTIARTTAPAHSYAVISDERVAAHWLAPALDALTGGPPEARVLCRVIPAGEEQKSRQTWAALTDWLVESGCGRDTTIVALGGGVIGDLAGFVAATFLRGVPVVQVPTSLLAMVDASVGGKTGVDTTAGKNLVGAFHRPAAVLIDPTVLSTLPRAHLRAGVAEMLKHGAIGDAYYFDAVAAFAAATHRDPNPDWTGTVALGLIARSVRFKADIVQRDERESGLRQVLNVGHTIAHAIERLSGFRVLHGEAVAIGLVLESRLAEWAGIARPGVASRLREALSAGGLPTALPRSLDLDALITAMRVDKKARGGRLSFALLAEIGRVAGDYAGGWTTVLGEDLIRAALAPSPSGPGNRAAADQPTV